MHDIYYGTRLPPDRVPIPLVRPDDRIGTPYLACDPDKIVAVVETDAPDRNLPFARPTSRARHRRSYHRIPGHEVKRGRLPALLPLQSGVGNIANAVLSGLIDTPFEPDRLYRGDPGRHARPAGRGKLRMASATAFSLSPQAATR
jgi:succinyl-CoA:acetate CoA-transferase